MPVYKDAQKTKDGKQWYVKVYWTINGQHHQHKSKKFATQKEAKKYEAMFLVENHLQGSRTKKFNELIEEFIIEKKREVKPQTLPKIERYCYHISNYLGDVRIDKLDRNTYESFRKHLAESDMSVGYCNRILAELEQVIRYSEHHYDVGNNIPFGYKPLKNKATKEMDFYTYEEFKKFIDVVDRLDDRLLFSMLYFCGLRIGEALALKFEDFVDGNVSINKTITTKMRDDKGDYLISSPKTSSSNRVLPLPKRVLELLEEHKKEMMKYMDFEETWFVFGGIKPHAESSITTRKNKYCKRAGVKQIRIHSFRHSFTSYMINNVNVDSILLVSKYLGHQDKSTTLNIYSHLFPSKLTELVKKIDEISE